jgi:guanine nucleotide-binding protein G(i) subunit alpha
MGGKKSSPGQLQEPKNKDSQKSVKKPDEATVKTASNPTTTTPKEIKMILLGSGESGKSTLFKQIRILHEQKFKKEELSAFRPAIYRNILTVTRSCIHSTLKRHPDKPYALEGTKVHAEFILKTWDNGEDIDELDADKNYDKKSYDAIQEIWKDPLIRKVFEEYRAIDFHIFDGSDYFFQPDVLERILPADKYHPTEEDMLRCRKKTIGIVEMKFTFNNVLFKLVDVGGQKNERRKWENAFKGVNVVLFVASLSDYDQLMYEDDSTNRMLEAIDLFSGTINNNWFIQHKIVLFLNKKDVFQQKLKVKPLTITFPDYKGETFEDGVEFIKNQFASTNRGASDRIIVKICQATDSTTVYETFEDIKRILSNSVSEIVK